MKAIIFGAGGQDGYYLTQILKREGVEVISLSHKECNVGVQGYVFHQLYAHKPDYVFHLAAVSTTSHDALVANQKAIVDGSLHILEGVKNYCPKAKVFLSGSVLQFQEQSSVSVSGRQSNSSIYAAQRNASVAYARYYRSIGIQVYVGYFSHHDSPMRGEKHLAKRLAIEAHKVARGEQPYVTIQNPSDEKEWNFAGDMMEAVWDQVNSPIHEAVLGSGVSYTIGDYVTACLGVLLPERQPHTMMWADYTREEPAVNCTDDRRFSHHFKTSLEDLAKMMVS